jgi:hypothetical protein
MTEGIDKDIVLRPSLRGSWLLFCGLLMALAIIFFERDPQGRDLLWWGMAGFFLILIISRLTQRYVLGREAITAHYLFAADSEVPWPSITGVELRRSVASRLSGTGHLLIWSKGQAAVTLAAQTHPEELRDAILKAAGLPSGEGPDSGQDAPGGRQDA